MFGTKKHYGKIQKQIGKVAIAILRFLSPLHKKQIMHNFRAAISSEHANTRI